jgi:hypothetical protein
MKSVMWRDVQETHIFERYMIKNRKSCIHGWYACTRIMSTNSTTFRLAESATDGKQKKFKNYIQNKKSMKELAE